MSTPKFIAVSMVALVGLGFFPGCKTTSPKEDTKPAEAAAAPQAAAASAASDAVTVPTKEILGTPDAAEQPAVQPVTSLPEPYNVYRISPGDLLRFISFDDEQLSADVAVRYDGCISLPAIPDLKVQDLTREEAEDQLKKAYAELYPDPRVTITVLDAKGKTFTVIGEVAQPAEYPYIKPVSLLEAISAAGGIRVNQRGGDTYVGSQGQLVKALVIRHEGGERHVQDYDLRGFNKSGPSASDSLVLPGDVVYVPESANLVYLLGEVGRPSVFALSEGLTLTRLFAMAGGFTETTAKLKQVVLIRQINSAETNVMTVDVRANMKEGKDILLQPGDIIYVPRKWLVNAAEFVQQLTAPASSAINFQRQVFGLYMDAYDAYYTKDRYDQLFNDNRSLSTTAILQNALLNTTNASTTLKTVPAK